MAYPTNRLALLIGEMAPVVVIDGTEEDDILVGTDGDDTIHGHGGDDVILTGNGRDEASGGDGDDILIGGEGRFQLRGDGGDDVLIGGDGFNGLDGGEGNDILIGGDESDILYAGPGSDLMDGGAGADHVVYSASDAGIDINLQTGTAQGGYAEGDILRSIEDASGSGFDDVIVGSDADNIILGRGGDDAIEGGAGDDVLYGDDDYIWETGDDVLIGGDGNDYLYGGRGADVLDGGDGSDTVAYHYSVTGGVTINLATQTASDGDAEGDVIRNFENVEGTRNQDVLIGDANDYQIWGSEGGDFIDGGAGTDTARYDDTYSDIQGSITIDLGAGTASGGDAEGDTLVNIENIVGGFQDDIITGDDGDNFLSGNDGNDTLSGGAGNDVLRGDVGGDRLTGGPGADSFLYNYTADSVIRFGADVIDDFSPSEGDRIDLSAFYADRDDAEALDLTYIGYNDFTGTAGELRLVQDSAATYVQIDTIGDGLADFELHLTDVTETLTEDSFLL